MAYGFYFDKYVTEDQYYSLDEDKRHLLLMKAIVLTDDQAKKFGSMMTHIVDLKTLMYDEKSYKTDCTQLMDNVCSSFKYGKSSFEATITPPSGKDRLVFFSIPYENGWSAEVNGQPVEIEKVDIGFMAVRVSGGITSNIVFKYKTPGLDIGLIVTGVSIVIYVIYLLISKKKNLIGPKLRLKKSYKVYAIGSADELGDRYRNLVVGRKPMKKKYKMSPVADDITTEESTAPAEETKAEEITSPAEETKAEENTAPAEETKAEESTEPSEETKADKKAKIKKGKTATLDKKD